MTTPMQVDPDDLLAVANGHMILESQLGAPLADLGPAPSDWPSGVGVMAVHDASKTLTAEMMARLAQHSSTLTSNAAQYQTQDSTTASGMSEKDRIGTVSSLNKDMIGIATSVGKDAAGLVTSVGSTLANAGVSAGSTAANLGVSVGSTLGSTAAKMSPHTDSSTHPEAGTPTSAAPAADHHDDDHPATQRGAR